MKRFPMNFACLLMLGLLLTPLLLADTGPKPFIDFTLTYQTPSTPTIINATLFECQMPDCSDGKSMMTVGPQGIRCYNQTSCSAMSYGFAPFLQLKLQFSDKNRTSNIFPSPAFSGSYDVVVRPDDLSAQSSGFFPRPPVSPSGPYEPYGPAPLPGLSDILTALLATLLIELPLSAIAFYLWKKPMKMLWLVAGVNIITVPLLWLCFVPLGEALSVALNENMAVGAILAFLFLELAVIIVEALALWKLSPKFDIVAPAPKKGKKKVTSSAGLSLLQAALLSFVMNVASMIGGFILLAIISTLLG